MGDIHETPVKKDRKYYTWTPDTPLPLPYQHTSKDDIVKGRKKFMATNQMYFYQKDPLLVMRSYKQYLYDEKGAEYLDCINNVAHIGHCHPYWVSAVSHQISTQATNVRYLHPAVTELACKIAKTMPPESNLTVTYFVNSGSEAVDLSTRIARAATGGHDVVALEHAYHGTLTSTTCFSPYKYHDKNPEELKNLDLPPDWVHLAPSPDPYRGVYRDTDVPKGEDVNAYLAAKYSKALDDLITQAKEKKGRKIAMFIAESIQSCGGQVIYPPDYMRQAYDIIRKHGGICVADEVQCGFGRIGIHYWGWQSYENVYPDICIIGKSMGNGYPVAGVVTTPEIAERFNKVWPQYFNTYGGNPVAATAALAVMEVIKSENLMEHADKVGQMLISKLKKLAAKYPNLIGEIRGSGLMVGIDLVTDPKSRTPSSELANEIKMTMLLDHKIIISTDGPFDNVLKIKPPMCFCEKNVIHLVESLEKVIEKLTK